MTTSPGELYSIVDLIINSWPAQVIATVVGFVAFVKLLDTLTSLKLAWRKTVGFAETHPKEHEKWEELLTKLERAVESNPALVATSPLELSTFGEKLATAISAQEMAKRYKKRLLDSTAQVDIHNHYLLQEFCLNILDWIEILSDEDLEKIDTVAYQNGTSRANVFSVLSIKSTEIIGVHPTKSS